MSHRLKLVLILFIQFLLIAQAVQAAAETPSEKRKLKELLSKPSHVTADEMKTYSEGEVKRLEKKIKELEKKAAKSKIDYEQKKLEAWTLYKKNQLQERGKKKDFDAMLEKHESLKKAKELEAAAKSQYEKDSSELAEAIELKKEADKELEKANKALKFMQEN